MESMENVNPASITMILVVNAPSNVDSAPADVKGICPRFARRVVYVEYLVKPDHNDSKIMATDTVMKILFLLK